MIEVIVATTIFLLFAIGAYQGFIVLYAAIASAHNKALATDLANAEFEIIKNLPYTSVGVIGGNPSGIIVAEKEIIKDSISFFVITTIINIDDPFDGMAGGGDNFPADYKLVEISIGCSTCRNFVPVVITGRVAPKNLESALKLIGIYVT